MLNHVPMYAITPWKTCAENFPVLPAKSASPNRSYKILQLISVAALNNLVESELHD